MGETTALAAESFCDVVREHARSQGDVIAFVEMAAKQRWLTWN